MNKLFRNGEKVKAIDGSQKGKKGTVTFSGEQIQVKFEDGSRRAYTLFMAEKMLILQA